MRRTACQVGIHSLQAFRHQPFKPLGAHGRDQVSKTCIQHGGLANGLAQLGKDLMTKDLPPANQRFRHYISSVKDQDIEDVIDQRRTSGSMILEQVEGRPTTLVQGDDFTVDHGLIGHRGKSCHDGRIATIEIVVVSRSELHATARFDCQSSVPVQLQLIALVRTLG